MQVGSISMKFLHTSVVGIDLKVELYRTKRRLHTRFKSFTIAIILAG